MKCEKWSRSALYDAPIRAKLSALSAKRRITE